MISSSIFRRDHFHATKAANLSRFVCLLVSGFFLIPFVAQSGAPAEIRRDTLEQGFSHPPDSARPGILWMWMDGNVTKEGITADLESMKRIGLGAVVLYTDISMGVDNPDWHIPSGPAGCLNPQWKELVAHALEEAHRLGLEVFMQNGPGWTGNGGPWVKVEQSMQRVITSERRVTGAQHINLELPRPSGPGDFYKDVAVLAVKLPPGQETGLAGASVTLDSDPAGVGALFDSNPETKLEIPISAKQPERHLLLTFDKPYTARSFQLLVESRKGSSCQLDLQSSDDGTTFTPIGRTDIRNMHLPQLVTMAFPAVTARYFRIGFHTEGKSAAENLLQLEELDLSPDSRLENWGFKTALAPNALPPQISVKADAQECPFPDPATVQNITKFLTGDRLEWDAPPGEWLILRMGHISTGRKVRPTLPDNAGYECDKLSREALDSHWENMMGKVIARSEGKLGGVHCDSAEAGFQNWTPGILAAFQSLCGYDPFPYLPVLTGRIMGSREISERFLWDWRRTISELQVRNNYLHLQELGRANGMKASVEPYGAYKTFDTFSAALHADLPMAEFWVEKDDAYTGLAKMISSAAHASGKSVVGAEAFTANGGQARWNNHPCTLKVLGDLMFTNGINRFMLHAAAHQPWPGRAPGMTFAAFGTHFYPTQTWWEQARAWVDYLSRSQFLLQQGDFVADFCLLLPEEFPGSSACPRPENIPPGYDFDACSADWLTEQMTVENGRLVLPGGMNYRLLLLPEGKSMSLKLLRKLTALVKEGATIVGARPSQATGLENYPACDEEVRKLAGDLWGDCNGKTVTEHSLGKGKVYWGRPLKDILSAMDILPDFEASAASNKDAVIRDIHRKTADADIYFVANGKKREEDIRCSFRVTGKLPELWHPDTGRIEEAPGFVMAGGRTTVPLRMDPAGSVFVVFRKPVPETELSAPESTPLQTEQTLQGPWKVSFPAIAGGAKTVTFEKPVSWTDSPDPQIKFYSGTATYSCAFDVPSPVSGMMLDLGRVEVIAEVKLNGKDLGILWKPPFRVDISSAVKPGRNNLEIKITNLWANRLIGDAQLPDDGQDRLNTVAVWPAWLLNRQPSPTGRSTFTTVHYFRKNDPLLPSGLLGPATILSNSGASNLKK